MSVCEFELICVEIDDNRCKNRRVLCAVCVNEGVTQELIDETRLSTENQMLEDLQKLVDEGCSLESRGEHGETPVCCSL